MESVYLATPSAPGTEPTGLARLACELGVEFTPLASVPEGALTVVGTADGLELRPSPFERGVRVDFAPKRVVANRGHRRQGQPFLRAIGRANETVLDATAGWGQDAFLLAQFGYDVVGVERSRVVYALLEDGRSRAMQDPKLAPIVGARLRFEFGDARAWIERPSFAADVVYLDPMFPPKRKQSALPCKEVQLLRRLVGADLDSTPLAELARQRCGERLVVKRPSHASAVLPSPSATHSGKLVRYDVYRSTRARTNDAVDSKREGSTSD